MKIQFNVPVTLNAEDGSKATFGKGLHDVDPKFANDWYLQAMEKDGSAVVLREEKEVEALNPKDVSEMSVKEAEKLIGDLDLDGLKEMLEAETTGKNRKSLVEQIEKAIEEKGAAQ